MNELSSEIYGPLELTKVSQTMIKGLGKTVEVGPPTFRPGTKLPVVRNAFVFAGAGMGDFICYMPSMIWLAENCPWIEGTIFCPDFFTDFAANVMAKYSHWKVRTNEGALENQIECPSYVTGPGVQYEGQVHHQLVNGYGNSLTRLGFHYFVNMDQVPSEALTFPVLNLKGMELPKKIRDLKYVVVSTGSKDPSRTVPGKYWNPILDGIRDRGMMPVFIGKSQLGPNGAAVNFPDDMNYHVGIDLRNQTSMIEAALIMKHAECSIGMDNGNVHLAACTDAKIVVGFNMVHPDARRPKRVAGAWYEIFPTKKEMPCIGCSSTMKRMNPHNFRNCLYRTPEGIQDTKCIDLMFDQGGKRWLDGIDFVTGKPLYLNDV